MKYDLYERMTDALAALWKFSKPNQPEQTSTLFPVNGPAIIKSQFEFICSI